MSDTNDKNRFWTLRGIAAVISAVAATITALVGMGVLGNNDPPAVQSTVSQEISFSIGTTLGTLQSEEIIDVFIGGELMGQLEVSMMDRSNRLPLIGDSVGLYDYELQSASNALGNDGLIYTYLGWGSGTIDVQNGDNFEVVILDMSSNPWIIGLQRE